jgi:cell volume regulation protein A
LSWAGLQGAIPVVLATIALAEGVDGASRLFAVVFVVSIVLTVVRGPTLPWVARRLGVAEDDQARDAEVESAPLERLDADLVQVRIPLGSRLHGVEVGELRLPADVSIALIVRNEQTRVPAPRTVLRHHDELLIVTPRALRVQTERRLRAVGRGGRLAGWFGEDGNPT